MGPGRDALHLELRAKPAHLLLAVRLLARRLEDRLLTRLARVELRRQLRHLCLRLLLLRRRRLGPRLALGLGAAQLVGQLRLGGAEGRVPRFELAELGLRVRKTSLEVAMGFLGSLPWLSGRWALRICTLEEGWHAGDV